jgi:lycopene cyclase domain-containing protein
VTRLTYLGFHAVFLLPPLVVLGAAVARRRARFEPAEWRARWLGFAILAVVAVGYTTPWDNYLIDRGVWWYGEGTVVATIWLAPVEEYLFMLLQPLVVVLWLALLASSSRRPSRAANVTVTRRQRLVGVVAGGVVLAVGAVCLRWTPTYYLGAILAWSGPVLALQWGFGWPYLWATRRTVVLGVGIPTLYFWVADRVAIELGVWVISETYTTGLFLVGLPIEEAAFFLVTNVFVVQGLVLFLWVAERWGLTSTTRRPSGDETDGSEEPEPPGRAVGEVVRAVGNLARVTRSSRDVSSSRGSRGRGPGDRQ